VSVDVVPSGGPGAGTGTLPVRAASTAGGVRSGAVVGMTGTEALPAILALASLLSSKERRLVGAASLFALGFPFPFPRPPEAAAGAFSLSVAPAAAAAAFGASFVADLAAGFAADFVTGAGKGVGAGAGVGDSIAGAEAGLKASGGTYIGKRENTAIRTIF